MAGDEASLVTSEEHRRFANVPALALPAHWHRRIARSHHRFHVGVIALVGCVDHRRLAGFLIRVHEAGIAVIHEPKINAWQFHGMLKETIFLPNALGISLPFPSEKLTEAAVESTLGRRRSR